MSSPLSTAHCSGSPGYKPASLAGKTHIPALDAHFTAHNARRTEHEWPLDRGDVIEVQGPAASGKTHLLYHFILTCIIPPRCGDRDLGGWGKAAILIDTDGNFNAHRFHEVLVSRLNRLLGLQNAEEDSGLVQTYATDCLERFVVFRPTSSVQLAITILDLPRHHRSDARLKDFEIGLLAIDSMSAFYWRDRFALEQLRNVADSSLDVGSAPNLLHYVVDALHQFRRSHRPVILMTNWGLNPLSKVADSGGATKPFYRQHLHPFPAPFDSSHGAAEALANLENTQRVPKDDQAQLNEVAIPLARDPPRFEVPLSLHYHITLHPSPIDPFPATYSLVDAADQEHMRAQLVEKAEIRGFVRAPGSGAVGEFTFCIADQEILVDGDG